MASRQASPTVLLILLCVAVFLVNLAVLMLGPLLVALAHAFRNRSAYENRGHAAACAFWWPSGSRDGASSPHSAASCAAVR